MKTNNPIQTLSLVLLIVLIVLPGLASGAHAQSVQTWSEPINLSMSGAAGSPSLVVDSTGALHAFWVDEFAGYQYAESADGIVWSGPVAVKVPFNKSLFPPVFRTDASGRVHIFWINEKNALAYAQADETKLGIPGAWRVSAPLDGPVYDFDAAIDGAGRIHVSYIKNPKPPSTDLAGVYYINSLNQGASWQPKKLLYESAYFRSLDATTAHVRLVASIDPEDESVYSVWDDRAQKRVFLGISRNAGKDWEPIKEAIAPDPTLGFQVPFGSDVNILNGKILLTWRLGEPGVRCALYSRVSSDGGESWDEPLRFLEESAQCPERTEFIPVEPDYSVMSMMFQGDMSVIAWNGSEWSSPETQTGPASISNPVTFEPVVLKCLNAVPFNNKLFVVGCDEGESKDIWFISRELDPLDSLFPVPSAWGTTKNITTDVEEITSVISVADAIGNIHVLWIQSAAPESNVDGPHFEYATWNGIEWSSPVPVITELGGPPIQPSLAIDAEQRLLLTWVDENSGDLLLSWANAERAKFPREWSEPMVLPSPSRSNDSPVMIVDASGRMVVVYSVAINENRGIYLTQSAALGAQWSPPQQVFDAASADWDRVNQPKLALTENGVLHLLFSKYPARLEEESANLYYSQSADGGVTWTLPELVSEQLVEWSYLIAAPQNGLHRFWMEESDVLHQFSQDGGETWSPQTTVFDVSSPASRPAVNVDWDGNVHLLQTYSDELEYIDEWLWSTGRWRLVESKKISVPREDEVTRVQAVVTANGKLHALFHFEYINTDEEIESELMSLDRSLELSTEPPAFTALVNTPLEPVSTAESTVVPAESTQVSPLAGLENPPPVANKNLVGLALIVLVVSMILVFIVPQKRRIDKDQ